MVGDGAMAAVMAMAVAAAMVRVAAMLTAQAATAMVATATRHAMHTLEPSGHAVARAAEVLVATARWRR